MVEKKIFGTDGIRGKFGSGMICPKSFRAIGLALGKIFLRQGKTKFLLGMDGRSTGEMLKTALLEGLPEKISVLWVGVLPTPAIAHAAKFFSADGAAAITASHNPPDANGIKFFSGDGRKWSDREESELEELLFCGGEESEFGRPSAVVDCCETALVAYRKHFCEVLPANCLRGKKVVLDTANGAASAVGAGLLASLGAEVLPMGNAPDGHNINVSCGSEHPRALCESVRRSAADWGLAVDGDGDRALVCDRTGTALAGEQLFARIALHFKKLGYSSPVVGTVLANGALDRQLAHFSIPFLRVPVGDRNVAEAMKLHGSTFGGEPSGHFLWTGAGPMADGLLTGALFFSTFDGSGRDSDWQFPLRPTAAENISVEHVLPLGRARRFSKMHRKAESALGADGRVLARYSGTENKLRLIVEARDEATARRWLRILCRAFLLDVADGDD
ncbi:MAG: hypothetical protein LBB14_02210 [Puniceicoccales bacterium]|jgi:phosphoglucosamine mutase|nr:hypothetical protein [Puniceicoccales bacterium]